MKPTCPIKPGHGEHCTLVGFPHIILGDNELDAIPALGLVQPLVSVGSHLGAERFRQDENISHYSIVWPEMLVRLNCSVKSQTNKYIKVENI